MNYSRGFVGNKLVSRVTSLFFSAVVELVLTKEKESNVYRMPLFPGICVEFHFKYRYTSLIFFGVCFKLVNIKHIPHKFH